MRIFLFACLLVLIGAGQGWTKDFFLLWAPVPAATSYVVSLSQDVGVTWKNLREVTIPNITISTPTDAPDNMIILVRVAAKNAQDETPRMDSGIWINTAWSPLHISDLEVK